MAVYPRECGGTGSHHPHHWRRSGLSPRVRGNLTADFHFITYTRSIPASAGEPTAQYSDMIRAEVYPRECGGTNPTLFQCNPYLAWTVYPRECGGTRNCAISMVALRMGLSPRVRGNHDGHSYQYGPLSVSRSIPASAGEPGRRMLAPGASAVARSIPASAGEPILSFHLAWWSARTGLSPRVRGNPISWTRTGIRAGSIPASAGEPHGTATFVAYIGKVYPRECGGTLARS